MSEITISADQHILAQNLRACCLALTDVEKFSVGDIVQWKPNMRNRRFLKTDQLAIVVEVLDTPVREAIEDPRDLYYGTYYDMVVGVLDDDDEFYCWHVCSARFTKVAV